MIFSKVIEKKNVILHFIKHQKVKKLSGEIKNSGHKKLSTLSIFGDLVGLGNLVLSE